MKTANTAGIVPTPNSIYFSMYGYLVLLLSIISLCLFAGTFVLMGSLFLLSVYTLKHERPALRRMVRIPIFLFAFAVFISALLFPLGKVLLQASASSDRLIIAFIVLSKSLLLLLGIQIVATRISVIDLTQFFERWGCRQLGFILGIALHMVPILHRHALASRRAMLLRGAIRTGMTENVRDKHFSDKYFRDGTRKNRSLFFSVLNYFRDRTKNLTRRLRAEMRWCMIIMNWMMRHADAICVAARTRGFGLTQTKSGALPLKKTDLIPVVVTLILLLIDVSFDCL